MTVVWCRLILVVSLVPCTPFCTTILWSDGGQPWSKRLPSESTVVESGVVRCNAEAIDMQQAWIGTLPELVEDALQLCDWSTPCLLQAPQAFARIVY